MVAVQSLDTVSKKISNIDSIYDNDFLKKTKFIDPKVFSGEAFSAANNEFFVPKLKINTIEKKVDDNLIKDIYTNNTNFLSETSSFVQDVLSLLILFDMKNKFMKNLAVNQNYMANYLDECSKLIQLVVDTANSESKLKMAELQKQIENATWWSAIVNIVLTIVEIAVAVFAIATGNFLLIAITIMALAQTLAKFGASIAVLCNPNNQKAIDYMQNGLFAYFGSDKYGVQLAQKIFNLVILAANIFNGFAHLATNGATNISKVLLAAMIANLSMTLIGVGASFIKSLKDSNDNEQKPGLTWDQALGGGIGGALTLAIFEVLRKLKIAPDSDKSLTEQEKWIIAEMITSALLSLVCTFGITYKYGAALSSSIKNQSMNLEEQKSKMKELAIKIQSALQGWGMQAPVRQFTSSSMNAFSGYKNLETTKVKADAGLDKNYADAFQAIIKQYETTLKDSSDQIADIIKKLAESIPELTKIMNQILTATMRGVR